MPSLQHKCRRMMLATPGGVGANDGVMQPGHKGPQVVATGCGYAAVEPLLSSKLIQIADKLDGHLHVVTECLHILSFKEV